MCGLSEGFSRAERSYKQIYFSGGFYYGNYHNFEYFKDRRNRIKVDEDGDANWWWERSPNGSNSGNFCIVNSNGSAYISSANNTYGVCFGFYI